MGPDGLRPDAANNAARTYEHLSVRPLAGGLGAEVFRATLEGLRAMHPPQKAYGAPATHNELVENMAIRYGEDAHLRRAQPMLRRHPESGRTALYVNWGYTESIEGWWPDESRALLEHLFEVSQHPAYTCRFRWAPGSIAVWDNRCTRHNPIADYAGQRREMWRITIEGEEPIPAPPS